MTGTRTSLHSGYRVRRSAVVQWSGVMSCPGTANDVDGLLQCGGGLRWVETPSADGLDGVPEEPGAQSELEAPVAEQIEGGRGLGDNDWGPQCHVEHVGHDPDPVGLGCDPGHERDRVEVAALVGVVLDGDHVVAPSFALYGEIEGVGRWCALRFGKTREFEVVAKVWHFRLLGKMPQVHAHPNRCMHAHATVRAPRPDLGYIGGWEGARVAPDDPLPRSGQGLVRAPLCPCHGHRTDGRRAVGAAQALLQRFRDPLLALG